MHHPLHFPARSRRPFTFPFFLLLLPLFLIPTYLYLSNLFLTLSLLSRPSNNPLCLPDHLLQKALDNETQTEIEIEMEIETEETFLSVVGDFIVGIVRFVAFVILWTFGKLCTFLLSPFFAVVGYLVELVLMCFGVILCVAGNGGAIWALIGEFLWKPDQGGRCWEFEPDLILKRIRLAFRKWFCGCCYCCCCFGRRVSVSQKVKEYEKEKEGTRHQRMALTIRDWVAVRSLGRFLSVRLRMSFAGQGHLFPGCGGGVLVGIVVSFAALIPGLRFLRLFKPRDECGWFMPLEEVFAIVLFMWWFYCVGFFSVPIFMFVADNKKEISELAAVHLTTSPLLSSVYYRRNLRVEMACSGKPCQLTQRVVQKIMSYLFSPYPKPTVEDGFWGQFGAHDPGYAPLNSAYNLDRPGDVDMDEPDEAVCQSIVLFHRAVPTARQFDEARLFGHLRLVCRDFYVGLNHMSSRSKFCHLNNLFYVVLRMKSDLRASDEPYFLDGPSVTWIVKRSFWELAVGLFPTVFFFVYRFFQTLLLISLVSLGHAFYFEPSTPSAIPTLFMFCAWGYAIWIGRRRRWVLESYRLVSEWFHKVMLWYLEEYEMEEYL